MKFQTSKSRVFIILTLSVCCILLNGCTSQAPEEEGFDTSDYIDEAITKSDEVKAQYVSIKEKLKNGTKLSQEEEKIIYTYIIGLFYQSFPRYKEEMDEIFPMYYNKNSKVIAELVSLPLSINPNYKGNLIKDLKELTDSKTYTWVMDKLDSLESLMNSMDKDSQNYKKTMYAIAEAKRALYFRLGDIDNEKKYEELAEKFERELHYS